MRARMALTAAGIVNQIREVSLQNKPHAMLSVSPKGTVPVLLLADGRVIDESLDIMYWALNQHDPERWLAPGDAMTDLIVANDGPFKFHLDRAKYGNRYPGSNPAEHRIEAVRLLSALEERLSAHAYLFGGASSLADVAIFPFARQFAHVDAIAFANDPLPALQAWLAKWETSDLFQSVMTKHAVWEPPPVKVHSR